MLKGLVKYKERCVSPSLLFVSTISRLGACTTLLANRTGKVCFQGWRQVHALKSPANLFEERDAQVDEAYYVPS